VSCKDKSLRDASAAKASPKRAFAPHITALRLVGQTFLSVRLSQYRYVRGKYDAADAKPA